MKLKSLPSLPIGCKGHLSSPIGCVQDLLQLKLELQEVVLAKEEQEEVLRRRERELTALKGALKDEVSTHDQEVDKLREQYEKEIRKLQASVDEAKQVSSYACLIKGLY